MGNTGLCEQALSKSHFNFCENPSNISVNSDPPMNFAHNDKGFPEIGEEISTIIINSNVRPASQMKDQKTPLTNQKFYYYKEPNVIYYENGGYAEPVDLKAPLNVSLDEKNGFSSNYSNIWQQSNSTEEKTKRAGNLFDSRGISPYKDNINHSYSYENAIFTPITDYLLSQRQEKTKESLINTSKNIETPEFFLNYEMYDSFGAQTKPCFPTSELQNQLNLEKLAQNYQNKLPSVEKRTSNSNEIEEIVKRILEQRLDQSRKSLSQSNMDLFEIDNLVNKIVNEGRKSFKNDTDDSFPEMNRENIQELEEIVHKLCDIHGLEKTPKGEIEFVAGEGTDVPNKIKTIQENKKKMQGKNKEINNENLQKKLRNGENKEKADELKENKRESVSTKGKVHEENEKSIEETKVNSITQEKNQELSKENLLFSEKEAKIKPGNNQANISEIDRDFEQLINQEGNSQHYSSSKSGEEIVEFRGGIDLLLQDPSQQQKDSLSFHQHSGSNPPIEEPIKAKPSAFTVSQSLVDNFLANSLKELQITDPDKFKAVESETLIERENSDEQRNKAKSVAFPGYSSAKLANAGDTSLSEVVRNKAKSYAEDRKGSKLGRLSEKIDEILNKSKNRSNNSSMRSSGNFIRGNEMELKKMDTEILTFSGKNSLQEGRSSIKDRLEGLLNEHENKEVKEEEQGTKKEVVSLNTLKNSTNTNVIKNRTKSEFHPFRSDFIPKQDTVSIVRRSSEHSKPFNHTFQIRGSIKTIQNEFFPEVTHHLQLKSPSISPIKEENDQIETIKKGVFNESEPNNPTQKGEIENKNINLDEKNNEETLLNNEEKEISPSFNKNIEVSSSKNENEDEPIAEGMNKDVDEEDEEEEDFPIVSKFNQRDSRAIQLARIAKKIEAQNDWEEGIEEEPCESELDFKKWGNFKPGEKKKRGSYFAQLKKIKEQKKKSVRFLDNMNKKKEKMQKKKSIEKIDENPEDKEKKDNEEEVKRENFSTEKEEKIIEENNENEKSNHEINNYFEESKDKNNKIINDANEKNNQNYEESHEEIVVKPNDNDEENINNMNNNAENDENNILDGKEEQENHPEAIQQKKDDDDDDDDDDKEDNEIKNDNINDANDEKNEKSFKRSITEDSPHKFVIRGVASSLEVKPKKRDSESSSDEEIGVKNYEKWDKFNPQKKRKRPFSFANKKNNNHLNPSPKPSNFNSTRNSRVVKNENNDDEIL